MSKINQKEILFIIPTLNSGGAERVVSILMNNFSKRNLVTVVILGAEEPEYDLDDKIEVIRLNNKIFSNSIMKLFTLLNRIFLLRRVFKRKNPHKIFSFMESANIPSILASVLLGKSKILSVSVRNNPALFPWFYRLLISFLYVFPARVIAPSNGIAIDLKSRIINNRLIEFIPNPIDIKYIQKMSLSNKDQFFEEPVHYILAVGRLTHQKGFDRLIHAFSKIQINKIRLVIIGEGEKRKELENLINFYDLKERVIMPGLLKNPFYLYKKAICLVLTSRYEGWPNVINEAISCSCPVVSYNCKYGPSEILNNGSGVLIDEGDEKALISAILVIYNNKKMRDALVFKGLQNIKQYSVVNITKLWLN